MSQPQVDEALFSACESGGVEAVRLLLDAGADVNAREGFGNTHLHVFGWSPLHVACKYGCTPIAQLLLDNSADVNALGEASETPLHVACLNGHLDLVRLLLEKGADVNARDVHDWTPLHYVCNRTLSNIEVILTLLSHGADVEARTANAQSTPIDFACGYGHVDVVKILLEAGADPRMANYDGVTPLDWALYELRSDNPARETILDWYREHHPEMVMERYCTKNMSPG